MGLRVTFEQAVEGEVEVWDVYGAKYVQERMLPHTRFE